MAGVCFEVAHLLVSDNVVNSDSRNDNAGWLIQDFVASGNRSSPFFQFTKKIPMETIGRPTIKETVNSSLRKRMPKRTPKIGVKKVKAESLLTE